MDLWLGCGVAELFPKRLMEYEHDRVFLVTSEKLRGIADRLHSLLTDGGVSVAPVMLIPEGEPNKNWRTLQGLLEALVQSGCTKSSVIVGIGGGVVSNVTGLAAALLYRGVDFVEVPTTLLNLTDGVLSNKQAVNGGQGKNQFGVYHAPIFVWGDTAYLQTEPIEQWRSGVVEAVKNGLINDAGWFDHLELVLTPDLSCVRDDPVGFCADLISSKAQILDKDPGERERCMVLEYGHTVGHAVEFLMDGQLLHGMAVGVGMCAAAKIGSRLGITDDDVLPRQEEILGKGLGCPIDVPANCAPDAITDIVRTDNKRRGSCDARMVFVEKVGTVHEVNGEVEVTVPHSLLLEVLQCSRRA
ncbi:2-deoxy-scyllo-inosose synthase [Propionibacterium sp. oral taxon 192]|uniref:2-deoxy-scyllo-inosose synthase n=1 Tax=Propionibacterium sp. oral taxon 192 TaxID=671222 RepID=UPI0018DDD715|nr:2-deoxy-scyllo-inosose synthase [Propionibacterium sp. oral taxon 192]